MTGQHENILSVSFNRFQKISRPFAWFLRYEICNSSFKQVTDYSKPHSLGGEEDQPIVNSLKPVVAAARFSEIVLVKRIATFLNQKISFGSTDKT